MIIEPETLGNLKKTRRCTKVIFTGQSYTAEDLAMTTKEFRQMARIDQRIFKPDLTLKKEEVHELLSELQKREETLKAEAKQQKQQVNQRGEEHLHKVHAKPQKLSRLDSINFKRAKIMRVYTHTGAATFRDIAKETGCHISTVRACLLHMKFSGTIKTYSYNGVHSEQTRDAVTALVEDPANLFASAGDLKRLVPQCSKKYIRRQLKAHGKRYLKCPRQRLVPVDRPYSPKEMFNTVSMITQAMLQNEETLYFLDEVQFPLNSTSDYAWYEKNDPPVYNRRPDTESLYVIAICDRQMFRAVQVHFEPVNKEGILYFMQEFLRSLAPQKSTLVLMDNAGWHKANLVVKSAVGEAIWFNVPRMYELNLIENGFSAVKASFRRRPAMEEISEEVAWLVELFRQREHLERFPGYRRKFLRNLIIFMN